MGVEIGNWEVIYGKSGMENDWGIDGLEVAWEGVRSRWLGGSVGNYKGADD